IIVGFPGETDAQFEDTIRLVQEVGYDSIFAFKYSPRPYTKALKFTDHVPEDVMSERLQRLLAVQRDVSFEVAKRYQDQVLDVLVENVDRNNSLVAVGRSTHNKLVQFNGDASLVGQIIPVRITKSQPLVLTGERVQ
ncbi:MAG: TRAM domain-containing protein, partial [Bdellovibrionales bacterium]|nr:TRAM domain-containing protein [Bdellovibrionales bacterium]